MAGRISRGLRRLGAVLAVLGSIHGSAHAQFVTGGVLAEQCNETLKAASKQSTEFVSAEACVAYIEGTIDATLLNNCIPKGVIVRQLVEIVSRDLNNNTRMWHLPAASLVYNSILNAFGCTTKPQTAR